MKVLLRHHTTGLFCGDAFQWVKDAKYARSFESQESAQQWITARQLSRVEVVVTNGDAVPSPQTPTSLTSAKAAF